MEVITHFFVENITYIVESYGLLSVFILMTLESALVPIPSEVTMPFAGFLAAKGTFSFWGAVTVGAFGNLIGSLMAYYLGFYKGEEWVRLAIKRWGRWLLIKEKDFDLAKVWFTKYGQLVAFVSRLLPIVRTFISLPAGIAKMNLPLFSLLTFVGSFIWSAFLAYLGLVLGQNWQAIEPIFRQFQFVIAGLFATAIVWYIWHHLKPQKK